jgi:hypothetical protein
MKNFLKEIWRKVKDYFKKKDNPESLFLRRYEDFIKKEL